MGLVALGVLLAAVTLGPPVALGQVTDPSPAITVVACTNNVPNNSATTANLGDAIDVSDYREVGLQVTFALTGAGTTACTFAFNQSADGTSWCTTAPISLALTPAGTAAVTTNASVRIGALPYIKLHSITAANNSAAMTNIVVKVVTKPGPKD